MSSGEKISKSHVSGVVTLIFVVLFIQGVLFLFGGRDNLFGGKDKNREEVVKDKSKTTYKKEEKADERKIEIFDPNTIDINGLIQLGLSPKQAQVVINYRIRGGKFRKPEDFSKIYVISPKMYDHLREFIDIKSSQENIAIKNIVKRDSAIVSKPQTQKETIYDSKITTYDVIYKERPLLSLNMADSTDLVSLPGIGPYYARKIIQYRERLGGFATKEQLLEIYGIDSERLDLFASRIDVDTNEILKSDLMEATFEELSSNPYIGGYMARSIIRYRDKSEKELINLANLVINNIIKKELYKILKYYFK